MELINMIGIYITIGLSAFVLFVLYDINSVLHKTNILKAAFPVGVILLTTAIAGLIYCGYDYKYSLTIVMLCIAMFFLILLIYTLFFALPFNKTYIKETDNPEVYTEGVYALCRHPGILWFIGMCAALAVALPRTEVVVGLTLFSICNVLYALMQDLWTFPRYFAEYNRYKATTPLLIPTGRSIRRCFGSGSERRSE